MRKERPSSQYFFLITPDILNTFFHYTVHGNEFLKAKFKNDWPVFKSKSGPAISSSPPSVTPYFIDPLISLPSMLINVTIDYLFHLARNAVLHTD